jgi:hypothetical protein
MNVIELVHCTQESSSTHRIEDGIFVFLGSGKQSLKLPLLVDETYSLKDLADGLLVVAFREVLFCNTELAVVLRKHQLDCSIFVTIVLT